MITAYNIKSISANLAEAIERNPEEIPEAPDGLCPNCWGTQEYGGAFYKAIKTHGLDVNTKDTNIGWIEEYVEKHLSPIGLQEQGEYLVCPTCKVSFKRED